MLKSSKVSLRVILPIGFLVQFVGDVLNLQAAMIINFAAFFYVFALVVWGKGKLGVM